MAHGFQSVHPPKQRIGESKPGFAKRIGDGSLGRSHGDPFRRRLDLALASQRQNQPERRAPRTVALAAIWPPTVKTHQMVGVNPCLHYSRLKK
jgi:hypothetical protein